MLKAIVNSPVRSGDQTITNGNLVIGTAARGVNFTANTPLAGMTSQLLNWYEEGTWTPTVTSSSGTFTTTSATGTYTRIGRTMNITLSITITTVGTASGAILATLPRVAAVADCILMGRERNNTGNSCQGTILSGATTVSIQQYNNASIIGAGNIIVMTGTYLVS